MLLLHHFIVFGCNSTSIVILIISQLRCFLTIAGQRFLIFNRFAVQWTGNPKAAGSIPVGRQFFALLVLSSRRSGGSFLGFRAGSL